MISVRSIRESDVETARELHSRFTDQAVSVETIRAWYEDAPELLVGAYADDGELVGICTGRRLTAEHAELAGLGVRPSLRRRGIGTQLVAAFEDGASEVGVERVSVASAGGYVDRFYAANGYEPKSVLVRSDPDDLPDDYREMGYDVVEEKTEGDTRKVYVDADELDPAFVEAVRDAFGDEDAIYVLEKRLQ